MAEVGYFAIVLALVTSIYAILVFIFAVEKDSASFLGSAKGATLAVALLVTLSTTILVYYLMTGEYTIKYVNDYTSNDLPLFYKFAALWAGNAGSLMLWLLLLVWYSVVVAFSKKTTHLTPYATTILLFNAAFFLLVLTLLANPFERVAGWYPGAKLPDGHGMNAMLQTPGMVFHPITTYLGYVGFAVPFAYAMAALLTRKIDDAWIRVTRRWTIVAWLFLTLGNLWGAEWAYVELGWGGFWGWDPVENASFIPWFTGSAFLHSVMIQERKNMLKIWNVSLITITYILTLFGTFLVRSGILTSVHAFGSGSLGAFFLAFTLIALIFGTVVILLRKHLLTQSNNFESFISKESSFLMNNLVLLGMAFAIFWGTVYPLISEALRGVKVTVGAPFFNAVSVPLGLAMFILMGICPLIAWRKATLKNLIDNFMFPALGGIAVAVSLYFLGIAHITALLSYAIATFTIGTIILEIARGIRIRHRLTGESYPWALLRLFIKNRRRHGGYIVHLGLVIILIAITGYYTGEQNVTTTLRVGESTEIGNYKVTYNFLDQKPIGNQRDAVFADISVFNKRTGEYLGRIEPQKVFYPTQDQPATEVGLRSTLKEDLYIILAEWDKELSATFKIHINPLIAWIWIGAYILIFGTIFALWPGKGSQIGSKFMSQHQLTS